MTPEEIEKRFKRIEARVDRIEKARRAARLELGKLKPKLTPEEKQRRAKSKARWKRIYRNVEAIARNQALRLTGKARERYVKRYVEDFGPLDLNPKRTRKSAK